MWASVHAQKMNIPVSMVTAADTPIFRVFFFFKGFPCRIIEIPDNGGPDNGGSTVIMKIVEPKHDYSGEWSIPMPSLRLAHQQITTNLCVDTTVWKKFQAEYTKYTATNTDRSQKFIILQIVLEKPAA